MEAIMIAREKIKKIAASETLDWLVTLTICIGVLLLVLNTVGIETYWFDKIILLVFTLEAWIKVRAFGWTRYLASGWNRFDLAIVIFGWSIVLLALFTVPVPEWAAALARVLRIVRLGEKVPAIRRVLQTLQASFAGLTGALLLAVLAMGIFVLAGTLMFQPMTPFADIGATYWSLTLRYGDAIGLFQEYESVVLGLFLQTYQVAMSLTIINLVITALIDGMQKAQTFLERYATRADIEETQRVHAAAIADISAQLAQLTTLLEEATQRVHAKPD